MGIFDMFDDENKLPPMGPELPPVATPSPADEYAKVGKEQDDKVNAVREGANKTNMVTNLLQAFSGLAGADSLSRGNKAPDSKLFDTVRSQTNDSVNQADAGRKQFLQDYLLGKKMNREQVEQQHSDVNFANNQSDRVVNNSRAATRFDQEIIKNQFENQSNKANAESLDASSAVSVSARKIAQLNLAQLAKDAALAGDEEGAAKLRQEAIKIETDGLNAKQANDIIGMTKGISYKDALGMIHNDKMAARADQKLAAKDAKMKQQYTVGVRKEIAGLPAYKDIQDLDRQMSSMKEIMKNPNAVSDEAFIVNFQKMLDPGSVVREGEFARTREGAGMVAKLSMMIEQAKGNGRVSPQMRTDILRASQAINDGAHRYFENTALAPYKEYMKAYDIPLEQVINVNPRNEEPEVNQATPSNTQFIKVTNKLPPIK